MGGVNSLLFFLHSLNSNTSSFAVSFSYLDTPCRENEAQMNGYLLFGVPTLIWSIMVSIVNSDH